MLFGAGNIGRSFIAELFASAGYEVVFVDINETVVDELNRRGGYDVVIKHPEGTDEVLPVRGVRAVNAAQAQAVIAEVARADIAATAVGSSALPSVAKLIGAGMAERRRRRPGDPLDVILAENVRDAASVVREGVRAQADASGGASASASGGASAHDAADEAMLGLVQTSIGKMVPIVPAEVSARDPLVVFAEPYDTLIVDAKGFRGELPPVDRIRAVDDIRAYVDRKLFLHNLGHAAVAYLGFQADSAVTLIADALAIKPVREGAARAMSESAAALACAYPSLSPGDLHEHRDDLLARFANRALGDTVFRVGRDLPRKLAREDRLVGAMLLAARGGLPFAAIAAVYLAALGFAAADESGRRNAPDEEVVRLAESRGAGTVLTTVSGLRRGDRDDERVIAAVTAAAGR